MLKKEGTLSDEGAIGDCSASVSIASFSQAESATCAIVHLCAGSTSRQPCRTLLIRNFSRSSSSARFSSSLLSAEISGF